MRYVIQYSMAIERLFKNEPDPLFIFDSSNYNTIQRQKHSSL